MVWARTPPAAAFLALALAAAGCGGGETAAPEETAAQGSEARTPEPTAAGDIVAEHPVTSPAARAAGIVDDGIEPTAAGDEAAAEPSGDGGDDAGEAGATPPADAG